MQHHIFRLLPGRAGAVFALCAVVHAIPAHAAPLALGGPMALTGVGNGTGPALTLPPVSDLDAIAAGAEDRFEVAYAAAMAEDIIRALYRTRPSFGQRIEPDVRAAFAARLHGPAPTSPTIAQLANPTVGSPQGVAVSFAQHLVSTGQAAAGLNSDLHVLHQTDGLDAGFDLAGRQNFVAPDPMQMSYDSHALVAVTSLMKLGVAARGSLGPINGMAFNGTRSAGPLLHLNLINRNVSLMSDVGYDFGLNPATATTAPRSQLHVAMNLKLKL
jgi:hypothetical protein